jgi:hypothetical protein
MDIYFVIKNIANNKYLSMNGDWDDASKSKEFNSKKSAVDYLDLLHGYFVIEKVYNP